MAEEEVDWEALFDDYMAAPTYPFNYYNSPIPFEKMINNDSTIDDLRTEIVRLEGLFRLYRRNQNYLGNGQTIAQQIRDEINRIQQEISRRFDENKARNVMRKTSRQDPDGPNFILNRPDVFRDNIVQNVKDFLGVKYKNPTNPNPMGRGLSYKGKKHGFIRNKMSR
jgi:hypothetical protein